MSSELREINIGSLVVLTKTKHVGYQNVSKTLWVFRLFVDSNYLETVYCTILVSNSVAIVYPIKYSTFNTSDFLKMYFLVKFVNAEPRLDPL